MMISLRAFPAGVEGVALLVARLASVAMSAPLLENLASFGGSPLAGSLLLAAALTICLGIFCRATSLLVTAGFALLALHGGGGSFLTAAALAAEWAALFVLGPGAFSVDGVRFGRRTVSVGRRLVSPDRVNRL